MHVGMYWNRIAAVTNIRLGIGTLYARGGGVPQGYAEAEKWWRMADS